MNRDQQMRFRGRTARTPGAIPLQGWWDVARRVFNRLRDANLSMLSAGVAFYATLAIFPALAAIVSLYALLSDPAEIQAHLLSASIFVPEDVTDIFIAQLTALASREQQSLGLSLVGGLLVTIWSAHRGINALVKAITVAYREKETRNFLQLSALTYTLTFGAVILIVLTLPLVVGIPAVLSLLPLPESIMATTGLIAWILFFVISVFSIGLLYRFAPPRCPARWRWLSPGALAGTCVWIVGSTGFSIYVSQFSTYNQTYGALSAIMVLLMWFYVTSLSIVLGATVNAELEHQTAHDTTIGKVKPLGQRDAYVADHVGKSAADLE